ncbi:transketolase family protein [Pseudodesulfovibrio portus]|uniref:Transketolase n=1 Tax=Pseudodesulfovibrio portus TaxID=231439 RepID=A0ABM8ANU0_9BACT|nr:transketolase C-terminal domain-containing protein [Pseudodesulfovibrio portus]BDQ32990.1 transketolase [Pseudodesulfovibrio portus]
MRKTCLNCIYDLAKEHEDIFFVGSDLGYKTLDNFKEEMPDRFFMEGISEQHVVGMAAGLAMEGKTVYVNTIATFLTRRCFDQTAMDLCLHNVPVRLVGNGGGMVYAPLGPTHMATEDVAIMRALPNMTVVAVCDAEEMKRMMPQTVDWDGPIYIRLAKGYDPVVSKPELGFTLGKGIRYQEGADVLLVSTGVSLHVCIDAAELLAKQGVSAAIMHSPTIKPFDSELLLDMADGKKAVVPVEEHSTIGGLGDAVGETLLQAGLASVPAFRKVGIPDVFTENYGSQKELMSHFGIDGPGVAKTVTELIG